MAKNMASVFFFPYFVTVVCSILSVPLKSHAINVNTNSDFSISLIHRDSPQSPFYNHSMTTYERLAAAARRSINRLHHLGSLSGAAATTSDYTPPNISSKIIPDGAEYMATVYIGTPTTQVTLFIDTGSELIWVKGPPFYDSNKSSTYDPRYCFDNGDCPSRSTCDDSTNLCNYQVVYGDGSTTLGIISYEDFAFDDPDGKSTVSVGNLQFGYATEAIGFMEPQNGCLGLNRKPNSFISQLEIKKFSHCFVIEDGQGSGSRMQFGSSAVVTNLTTPIEPSMNNGYYVTLDGIRIGDTLVNMPPGAFKLNGSTGGVMLDIGTTYTLLRREGYDPFISEMRQHINKPLVDPIHYFDFCFEGTYADLGNLPSVTFFFARVGVELIKESTYVEAAKGTLCLAILPSRYQFSVIGNFPMRNLWIGYDLERQEISFASANCSTF